MSAIAKKQLGEILVNAGMISEQQLKGALEEQKRTKVSLGQILVDKGIVTARNIKDALELQYGISYMDISNLSPDPEAITLVPIDLIKKHQVVPINRLDNVLKLGMVDPNNLMAKDDIRMRLKGISIQAVVITEDDFQKFLQAMERTQETALELGGIMDEIGVEVLEEEELDQGAIEEATKSAEEAPIVKLANKILATAVLRGVSDIHMQPQEKTLQLRYRQDGVLHLEQNIPKKLQMALVSRFKIMANLDIAEKRLPQDGRIRIRVKGRDIDFRVSTLPSKFGEKVVMRILDKSSTTMGLEKLITFPEILAMVREMIDQPYGIVFVTGPTGSGKTTTLYSALNELNDPAYNIVTAEDPIEYDLGGITQVQIHHAIGLDFASVLRSFLRQDPDIILVGETRDKETAKIAVESALTGHMVFTTLHTNDAPSAVTRLGEMGVEPFLVASATLGIMAQRLLRRICSNCKQEYKPSQTLIDYFSLKDLPDKPLKFYKGKGCEKCSGSGYKGRVGVYEVMKMTDEIRDLVVKEAPVAVIRHAAVNGGMVPLRDYALRLVQEGHTTIDEVRANILASEETGENFCPKCLNPVSDQYVKCPFCAYQLKKTCPNCNEVVEKSWESCAHCGAVLIEEGLICTGCFNQLEPDWKVCPYCDTPVPEKTI